MKHIDQKPFKVDRNGTQYFLDWTCPRCGGAGGADQWTYTGWNCYECGGTGRRKDPKTFKVYTPEYEAKLMARRKAKMAVIEAKEAEDRAREERMRIGAEESERRARERREAEEKARKARSKYVGEVGQKFTTKATYTHSAWYMTQIGWTKEKIFIHNFRDTDGNAIIWKTQKGINLEESEEVEITGTVKEHKEYKDEKQTALIRCKINRAG